MTRRIDMASKAAAKKLAAAPVQEQESVGFVGVEISVLNLDIVGDSPLISHRWSEKAKKAMLDKQMKKAKQAKEAKDPEEDYRESLFECQAPPTLAPHRDEPTQLVPGRRGHPRHGRLRRPCGLGRARRGGSRVAHDHLAPRRSRCERLVCFRSQSGDHDEPYDPVQDQQRDQADAHNDEGST